ncbi:hypothetical protein IEC97_14755 [Neobacillus cucumis]|uniref:hypothetical protein n=1 Tax=Neobacillus cucumis TaxID=1740721 RepID=UPI0018E0418B|nr:hypothetical protein [Neobacillus cucumis]MBI0578623.1 hypothetical protein [Neobacillus cucumis]
MPPYEYQILLETKKKELERKAEIAWIHSSHFPQNQRGIILKDKNLGILIKMVRILKCYI